MEKNKDKRIDMGEIDPFQLTFDFRQPSVEDAALELGAGLSISLGSDSGLDQHSALSISLGSNSRCVPVGTLPITPGGCNRKQGYRIKRTDVKFRCTVYEKKLLKIKAKRSRLSVSEFCRRAVFEMEIKERLSDEHIEIYKTLVKYHNNFKSIRNMFRKKDPNLSTTVYKLAEEIKEHLQNLKQ